MAKMFVVQCAGLNEGDTRVWADGYSQRETKANHITEVVFYDYKGEDKETSIAEQTRMMLVAPWSIYKIPEVPKAPEPVVG